MRLLLLIILAATAATDAAERAPLSEFMEGFRCGTLFASADRINHAIHLLEQVEAGTLTLPAPYLDELRKSVVTDLMAIASNQARLGEPGRRLDERMKQNLAESGRALLKGDPAWIPTLRAVVAAKPFPAFTPDADALVQQSVDRYAAHGHPWVLGD